MKRKNRCISVMLTAAAISSGIFVSVSAEAANQGTQAIQAYRDKLSQGVLDWGTISVDSSSVKFAPADINGDSVPELLVHAVNGVAKQEGYYELWSWQNGEIQRNRDIRHFMDPISYDPTVSMIYEEGAIKGIYYYEYYSYADGELTLFLSHKENPDLYGSLPETSYTNEAEMELSAETYQSLLTGAIGNGECLKDFIFYENTWSNREDYLSIDSTDSDQGPGNDTSDPTPGTEPGNMNPGNPTPGTSEKHTYQVFVEDCTWSEAAEKCESMGGHLAQINDPIEFYEITDMLEQVPEYRGKVFFLGGQRQLDDTAYYWTDSYGQRVEGEAALNTPDSWAFNYWGPGEPSYSDKGVEEYVLSLFKYNGVWILNDEPQSMLSTAPEYAGYIGYICEFGDPVVEPQAIHEDDPIVVPPDEEDPESEAISMEEVLTGIPKLVYASGVGAWQTSLEISPDGTFSGVYGDTDSYSEDPNYSAVYYNCAFTGQFTNLRKVNDYTYAMDIAWMEKNMDTQIDDPLIKLVFSEHPGLEPEDTVYMYVPGTPISMLDPEFTEWVSRLLMWEWKDEYPNSLKGYGVYDEQQQTSFVDPAAGN